jgi:hypothetical protein
VRKYIGTHPSNTHNHLQRPGLLALFDAHRPLLKVAVCNHGVYQLLATISRSRRKLVRQLTQKGTPSIPSIRPPTPPVCRPASSYRGGALHVRERTLGLMVCGLRKARYSVKWRSSEGKLVLKITDDVTVRSLPSTSSRLLLVSLLTHRPPKKNEKIQNNTSSASNLKPIRPSSSVALRRSIAL